jgi:hypothetical protein
MYICTHIWHVAETQEEERVLWRPRSASGIAPPATRSSSAKSSDRGGSRPSRALFEGHVRKKQDDELEEAYRELENVWQASYTANKQQGHDAQRDEKLSVRSNHVYRPAAPHSHDAVGACRHRERGAPQQHGVCNVSFGSDDDFEAILEDDEEDKYAYEDNDSDDAFDERDVASPRPPSPHTRTAQPVNVKIYRPAARVEYVPPSTLTPQQQQQQLRYSHEKMRFEYAQQQHAERDEHEQLQHSSNNRGDAAAPRRPFSAPSQRRTVRLTVMGTLASGGGRAAADVKKLRPSSAGCASKDRCVRVSCVQRMCVGFVCMFYFVF